MCSRRYQSRTVVACSQAGFTLIEVMIASAVLAIGLSAIGLTMVYTSAATRDSTRKAEAAMIGMSTAEEWSSRGFTGLTLGVFDGGSIIEDGGVAMYTRVVTVLPFADMDAGFAMDGFIVNVDVSWSNYQQAARSQRFTTIVTGPFDGG